MARASRSSRMVEISRWRPVIARPLRKHGSRIATRVSLSARTSSAIASVSSVIAITPRIPSPGGSTVATQTEV